MFAGVKDAEPYDEREIWVFNERDTDVISVRVVRQTFLYDGNCPTWRRADEPGGPLWVQYHNAWLTRREALEELIGSVKHDIECWGRLLERLEGALSTECETSPHCLQAG